jgi:hypothetical protein
MNSTDIEYGSMCGGESGEAMRPQHFLISWSRVIFCLQIDLKILRHTLNSVYLGEWIDTGRCRLQTATTPVRRTHPLTPPFQPISHINSNFRNYCRIEEQCNFLFFFFACLLPVIIRERLYPFPLIRCWWKWIVTLGKERGLEELTSSNGVHRIKGCILMQNPS